MIFYDYIRFKDNDIKSHVHILSLIDTRNKSTKPVFFLSKCIN